MAGGAGRGGRRLAVLGQGCRRARCLGFAVLFVGAVQLLDKVADMPVAVPLLQFVLVVDDPVVQVVAGFVQFLDKVVDTPVVSVFDKGTLGVSAC